MAGRERILPSAPPLLGFYPKIVREENYLYPGVGFVHGVKKKNLQNRARRKVYDKVQGCVLVSHSDLVVHERGFDKVLIDTHLTEERRYIVA